MNGDRDSITKLLSELVNADTSKLPELVLCPPFVYIEKVGEYLAAHASPIRLGAQQVSSYNNGAYTGEVSASMLKDLGCSYALVGHSERRILLRESDQDMCHKVRRLKEVGLVPVLCVGETQDERRQGQTENVLLRQLQPFFAEEDASQLLSGCVFAYEPVWAIGSGLSATPEQAQAVHAFIRGTLLSGLALDADRLCILYGGSVKVDNAASLFAMPDIDGALVGGASLSGKDFLAIAKAASN